MSLFAPDHQPSPIQPPHYTEKSGKRRTRHACALNWPRRGRYSRVARARPYPDRGEKGCRWIRADSPSGRKMFVAAV